MTTSYTYLPWARRGLAAHTPITGPAPLPAQAQRPDAAQHVAGQSVRQGG